MPEAYIFCVAFCRATSTDEINSIHSVAVFICCVQQRKCNRDNVRWSVHPSPVDSTY